MRFAWVFGMILALAGNSWGAQRVRVVATLPDLADWVREVGGERVEVSSLLNGLENPHTYEPRVSDVKAIAGARVLVRVGLGLEAWLDGMVENARNSELIVVDAARGVEVIDEGDDHGHGRGNPHVWLDPENAVIMCRNIERALETVDPMGGEFYQKRYQGYATRLRMARNEIATRVAALPDRRFLSYHPAWPYFARGLGYDLVGVVTERPGQEPSARSLAHLIRRIRTEKIPVLVTEPQLSSKLPDLLRQETGIRVVTLSPLLGPSAAGTYVQLLEANAGRLDAALESARP